MKHSLVAVLGGAVSVLLLASGCTPATQSHEASAVGAAAAADQAVEAAPVQVIDKAGGQDLYMRFCASCHGPEGRGDGPAADVLAVVLPDLTRLTQEGQPFPMERVEEAIRGPRPGVHGSPEMPVWGPDLMGAGENWTDAQRKSFHEKRIRRLAKYLESIQESGA